MKKKIYFGIVSFLFMLFCFSVVVSAESEKYKIGDDVYCYTENGTLIIEGNGTTYDYCDDGYDKTGKHQKPDILKKDTYYAICIKDGVTSIGDYMFQNIRIYRFDHISKDLKRIGQRNLVRSRNYIDYNIFPNGIECIDRSNRPMFIVFPDKVNCLQQKEIYSDFYIGENISHIVISNKTKTINYRSFEKLKNLKTCEIPPSVTHIDNNVFWRNTENLTIKGFTGSYAEEYAKEHKIKFESVGKVPSINKVYSIGNYKYKLNPNRETMSVTGLSTKGKNLKSVSIPSTVTIYGKKYKVDTIAKKAFYKNKNISKVTLGSNIAYIEQYAFASCPKLRTVKINCSDLKQVKSRAFYNNKNLTVQLPKKKYSKYKSMIAKSGIDKKTKYVKF